MNTISFILNLFILEFFYTILAAPFIIVILIINPNTDNSIILEIICTIFSLVLVVWILFVSPWFAYKTAKLVAYEYFSYKKAIIATYVEARTNLSFLPFIGDWFKYDQNDQSDF